MRSSFLSSAIVWRTPSIVNSKSISGLLPHSPSADNLPWRIDLFFRPGACSVFLRRGELVERRGGQGHSQPLSRAFLFPPILKIALDESGRSLPFPEFLMRDDLFQKRDGRSDPEDDIIVE